MKGKPRNSFMASGSPDPAKRYPGQPYKLGFKEDQAFYRISGFKGGGSSGPLPSWLRGEWRQSPFKPGRSQLITGPLEVGPTDAGPVKVGTVWQRRLDEGDATQRKLRRRDSRRDGIIRARGRGVIGDPPTSFPPSSLAGPL